MKGAGTLVVLAVLLTAPGFARAAEAKTASAEVEVTLDEFLHTVPKRDKGFHRVLIEELKLKYRKALALPAGDLVTSVHAGYEFNPGASVDKDSDIGIGLWRLFPKLGTELFGEVVDSRRGYGADISHWEVGLTQDIARNAFGRGVRLDDRIVDIGIAIARHQIVEAYEDYLARLVVVYLDWYFAHENLKAARQGHGESLVLLKNVEERRRRSVALGVDVDKVRLQAMSKEERVVRLEADYQVQSNLVRRSMGLDPAAAIVPRDPAGRWDLPDEVDSVNARFASDSRTARLLRGAEARGEQTVLRYADDLLPSLKLGVAYRATSVDAADDEYRVLSSVDLDLPLSRPRERARHKSAKVDLERAKLTTEDVLSQVGTDLRNLVVRIEAEQERIRMTEERITISEGILAEEKENYSFGRTSLNDLIRFVDALEDQRFARIARSVQRTRYLVEWMRLSDRLVSSREVLKKGD